jgi:Protein of unknown function (DUF992)
MLLHSQKRTGGIDMNGARALAGTALGVLLALLAGPDRAEAQTRVEVGVLTCKARGGTGFVIVSTTHFRCRFHRPGLGADEFYAGDISKFGIDVGTTKVTSIAWAVLAPTSELPPRSLSGKYGGVGAEATLGVGIGANALLGGSGRGIILQPLSVQAQQGLNVAAAIEALQLRSLE